MTTHPYHVIHELDPSQTDDLHRLYQKEWWTQTRDRDELDTMLANSDVVHGLIDPATGTLLAFARALTDGIYKAIVFDVIVDDNYRNKGCGRILMDSLLDRPELVAVKHVELFCKPGVSDFYSRWNFVSESPKLQLMRRDQSASDPA